MSPEFPRTLIHHEPDNTDCACGCALKRNGEDVSEKLDYTPGVFSVERHIPGKWICDNCETPTQAPVPARVRVTHPASAGDSLESLTSTLVDSQVVLNSHQADSSGICLSQSPILWGNPG